MGECPVDAVVVCRVGFVDSGAHDQNLISGPQWLSCTCKQQPLVLNLLEVQTQH